MPPKGSGLKRTKSSTPSGRRTTPSSRAIASVVASAVASAVAAAETQREEVTWFSDDMFEVMRPDGRSARGTTGTTYRLVTLRVEYTPEILIKVQNLMALYSGQVQALRRNAPAATTAAALARNQRETTDASNVLKHLQVLYEWRTEPARFVSKLKSFVDPFEKRTFLFRASAGSWMEVKKGEAGKFVEELLKGEGFWE